MTKARRTRQQKIIADLHRKLHAQNQGISLETPVSPSLPKQSMYSYTPVNRIQTASPSISLTSTQFVRHDLFKTAIVTSGIIIMQLLLFYLLKIHILIIPMISF